MFAPALAEPFRLGVHTLASTPRRWGIARPASLMKVFWPYLVFDTVFDNTETVDAMGYSPAPFSSYADGLLRFARDGDFRYPYRPWPTGEV
jgi:hypothetical protein